MEYDEEVCQLYTEEAKEALEVEMSRYIRHRDQAWREKKSLLCVLARRVIDRAETIKGGCSVHVQDLDNIIQYLLQVIDRY